MKLKKLLNYKKRDLNVLSALLMSICMYLAVFAKLKNKNKAQKESH